MKYHKFIIITLFFLLMFSIFSNIVQADDLSDIQKEQQEKEEELQNKQAKLSDITKTIDSLTTNINELQKAIQDNQSQIDELENEIAKATDTVNKLNNDIQKQKNEYDKKLQDYQNALVTTYKTRIKKDITLEIDPTEQAIVMQKYTEEVQNYRYHILSNASDELIAYHSNLQEWKQLKQELVSLQQQYKEVQDSLYAQKEQYDWLVKQKQQEATSTQEEINYLSSEIAQLSAQAEAILEQKAEQNNVDTGSGSTGAKTPSSNPGTYNIIVNDQEFNNIEGPIRISSNILTVHMGNTLAYRGTLEIREDTNVYLINELSLEDYVKGLSEMPSSWNLEALKAQAVIGRSYAVANLGKRSAYNFDLYDNTLDQYYLGYYKETSSYGDRWVNAVNQTVRKVVTYNGNVIPPYYHASCGGHTLSTQDVWGGYTAWNTRVSDWYEENGQFKAYDESSYSYKAWGNGHITYDILVDLINAAIYLQINNASASAQDFVINATNGGLSSQLGDKEITQQAGDNITVTHIYNNNKSTLDTTVYETKYLQVTGGKTTLNVDAKYFKLAYNLRSPADNVIWSSLWDVVYDNEEYKFYSRGFPHRVGLCQWGAKKHAELGKSYQNIISHYFSNVNISETSISTIRIGLTAVGPQFYITSNTCNISGKNGIVYEGTDCTISIQTTN